MNGKVVGDHKLMVSKARPKSIVGRVHGSSHLGGFETHWKPKYAAFGLAGSESYDRLVCNEEKRMEGI